MVRIRIRIKEKPHFAEMEKTDPAKAHQGIFRPGDIVRIQEEPFSKSELESLDHVTINLPNASLKGKNGTIDFLLPGTATDTIGSVRTVQRKKRLSSMHLNNYKDLAGTEQTVSDLTQFTGMVEDKT